jgi:DNA-binding CsgD family transcriptional regulator
MSAGYQDLTEKEKQTLRLIVRGHDAKSTARHLGLSVHTVNERLRDARRKLEVSSSREAARLLLDKEGEGPQKLGDKQMGDAAAVQPVTIDVTDPVEMPAFGMSSRVVWLIAGVVIMSVVVAILALAVLPQSATTSASSQAPAAAPVTEAEVVRVARDWLVLHDEGRWREAYDATTRSFRKLNTVERWTEVAREVRPPLGAVISRVLISQESVPAPPAGVQVVKFRTSFANKENTVETISLTREDGAWKVVGIYIG